MEASLDGIKELREQTSCGVIDCKKALEEAKGDIAKAKVLLQKRGLEIAAKKGSRLAKEGRIEGYVHMGNKIAVLVEVNCETDFVARNEKFCAFTKDLAMHIAAVNPKYIKEEDVPEDVLVEAKDKEAFIKESCLLQQPFVKDASRTIQDYLNNMISKIGENILIGRFIRYKVGESE
ncbi:MAG: elongation factor Ts [Candidatus Omnitrophica bacterium]|nr:elongation factor Ts [Candidatus Omnitrophota bacterium]